MMTNYTGSLPNPAEPLVPRIRRAAEGPGNITFIGSAAGKAKKEDRVSWQELHRDALAVAAALQARGLAPGDHVALLGPTSRPLVTAIQAVWLAGGCVSMLPIPMRFSSLEDFIRQTRLLLHHGDARLLLLDPALEAFYKAAPGDPPVVLLSEIQPGPGCPTAEDYREVPDDPERLAILQFTSGSTSDPKGVMLPHRTVGANLDGMTRAAELVPEDNFVSWLPLYHDMGLVGFLTVPMTFGCSLVLASPQDFLSNPADWMRWMSDYRGTITAGPNFSWVLATRALRRMNKEGERLDLSAVRIALNGAEPVDPVAVDNFVECAKVHGFRPGAVFCAFGMAEVTIGGTFPPPLRGMVCDTVDRLALESESLARPADCGSPMSKRLPLLGRLVPGLEVRVCNPVTGKVLKEREVGELELRGASVTPGYYKRPDLNEQLFHDGWLRSGDLAYLVNSPSGDAELVLCGRIKDVIIVAGRNIYPEDIERAVGQVDGVRAGNVIAFGVESAKGKEDIVVVAEVRTENPAEVRRQIRRRVLGICSVAPRDIVLVPPGTVPKTSSGKLQRSLCRRRYLNKELPEND